jgi:hypothetical protein
MVACVNGGIGEGQIAGSSRYISILPPDLSSTGTEGWCSTRTVCGLAPSIAYRHGLNNGRKSWLGIESAAV